jgi:hypothetical protein
MRDAVGNFLKSPAVQVNYNIMHFSFMKRYLPISNDWPGICVTTSFADPDPHSDPWDPYVSGTS